jgi:hypothetical protein
MTIADGEISLQKREKNFGRIFIDYQEINPF